MDVGLLEEGFDLRELTVCQSNLVGDPFFFGVLLCILGSESGDEWLESRMDSLEDIIGRCW